MMKNVLVYNQNQPQVAPILVKYCDSFLCRLKGLMFSSPLTVDRGLLLVYKQDSRIDTAIHMLAVKSDLAVVWINHLMKVVDRCIARKGKLIYLPAYPACFVLEMNPARFDDFNYSDEVRLEFLNQNEPIY
jgi:hypothetical protein